MSGIAGIYNLDGRPVDRALLERMTNAMAHRGPDGRGHWINGPVGLGHLMLCTTPEAVHERQPLADETGDLCLTFDGRVDNREELKSALEFRGFRLRDDTDAELVLKSYSCWGEESPAKILGDFAFAIWDKSRQQLFCARDAIGIKPFFYYTDGVRFLWASELQALFAIPGIPCEPNEGMVGEYLAVAVTSREETLYRGILRLPAAHTITIRQSRVVKRRYWDIDPSKEIRCRSDDEYAEQFRAIFSEAVRCRLRSSTGVGAELSSGLDSSSIIGMAYSLFFDGLASPVGFETFSLVFPGKVFDESVYMQEVVRKWNLPNSAIAQEYPGGFVEDQGRSPYDLPDVPNQNTYEVLLTLAGQKGLRVMLTGCGGDDWLTGSEWHCADLLRKMRVAECIRELRNRSESGVTWASFFGWAVLPLLPESIRQAARLARSVVGRSAGPLWIPPGFSAKIHLRERTRMKVPAERFRTHAQRQLYLWLAGGLAHVCEIHDCYNARFSMEYRYPFHDRRVIEFALALPENQRWRGEQTKFILRNSMRSLLPSEVRARTRKVVCDQLFAEALEARGGERLFDSLAIASLGWVQKDELVKMYRQLEDAHLNRKDECLPHIWPLSAVFAVDSWFRTVFMSKQDGLRHTDLN